MKISEILKNYLNENKMSMREFSRRCGLSNTYIANIVNGTDVNPSLDALSKIAFAMGITSQQLFDKLDGEQNIVISRNGSTQYLDSMKIIYNDYFPLHYCTNLSAGSLEELLDSDPDAIVYVPIKYQMMKNRLNAFKVNGTSMNNVIPDGSIVIAENVSHLSKIKDGTIVVAWVDGVATVKRLYNGENQITLMPDSSDKSHLPIFLNLEDNQVHIIGRVIWHMNPDNLEEKYY